MKYRIIVKNNDKYPFSLQERKFLFWAQVDVFSSLASAEEAWFRVAEQQKRYPPGTVLKEFSDSDLLTEKLKR